MRILAILLLCTTAHAQSTWERAVVARINVVRADADVAEETKYQAVLAPRLPLTVHPTLTESAQWWCDALKSAKLGAVHAWYVNADGYLIQSPEKPKILSRVWLPSYDGYTTGYADRAFYLGLFPTYYECQVGSSENGGEFGSTDPAVIVAGWKQSGWNEDPRKALHHYANLINPRWTHVGAAWGGGQKLVFAEFAEVK